MVLIFAKPLHMKSFWACAIFLLIIPYGYTLTPHPFAEKNEFPVSGNLFIITTDGFRWQEVFTGADSVLLNDERITPDTGTLKALYWSADPEERRKKLMPFTWNVMSKKGQLYGNRYYNNKMDAGNMYSLSYPGYNEIFTGNTDIFISSNKKRKNPNNNVLEYLYSLPAYKNKMAVFSSWDVFPYILNEERNDLPVNSGYESMDTNAASLQTSFINAVQDRGIYEKTATRMDALTFLAAKEYIQQYQPKIIYLALGETDEFAHKGRYDLYLQQANKVDAMIAELWHWVQTTPGYKDNTTFIITTDHGRGSKPGKWTTHGVMIKGSSQTWLAVMGPGIAPLGEIKDHEQLYQQQLAQTIAHLVRVPFVENNAASAIVFKKAGKVQ
jgi:hypothetical protein